MKSCGHSYSVQVCVSGLAHTTEVMEGEIDIVL